MAVSCGELTLGVLGDVSLEKVIERRPDRRNRGELADVVPGWCNRRADDVGRELELEAEQQPDREADPDLFPVHDLLRPARYPPPQREQQALDGTDRNEQDGAGLHAERDGGCHLLERLFHQRSSIASRTTQRKPT